VEDNLRVKEVFLGGKRYIVCLNPEEARKDQKTREKILSDLEEKLRRSPKDLIGNKGYRRYLKVEKEAVKIDEEKLKEEERPARGGVCFVDQHPVSRSRIRTFL
jgi:DNA helicase HerA-like ATPase